MVSALAPRIPCAIFLFETRAAKPPRQADKLRTQQELERLQAKYIGTGHPDTTSWEWKTNIHRDTHASVIGHPPLLAYMALAQNEPVTKLRAQLIRVRFALDPPLSSYKQ
jgi:splicing factor 3B subunit 5